MGPSPTVLTGNVVTADVSTTILSSVIVTGVLALATLIAVVVTAMIMKKKLKKQKNSINQGIPNNTAISTNSSCYYIVPNNHDNNDGNGNLDTSEPLSATNVELSYLSIEGNIQGHNGGRNDQDGGGNDQDGDGNEQDGDGNDQDGDGNDQDRGGNDDVEMQGNVAYASNLNRELSEREDVTEDSTIGMTLVKAYLYLWEEVMLL